MTRTESVAQASRRFIEADKRHAVARAKADSLQHTLQRLATQRSSTRAA